MTVADSNKTFRDPGPAETVCPVETARRLRAEAKELRERSARLRIQFYRGREVPQGHPQHPEPIDPDTRVEDTSDHKPILRNAEKT